MEEKGKTYITAPMTSGNERNFLRPNPPNIFELQLPVSLSS